MIVVFLALCLMAVSPYLRLGLISNGIRDTKDFFVYAALGTDDKYIGYELKKGEVGTRVGVGLNDSFLCVFTSISSCVRACMHACKSNLRFATNIHLIDLAR